MSDYKIFSEWWAILQQKCIAQGMEIPDEDLANLAFMDEQSPDEVIAEIKLMRPQ